LKTPKKRRGEVGELNANEGGVWEASRYQAGPPPFTTVVMTEEEDGTSTRGEKKRNGPTKRKKEATPGAQNRVKRKAVRRAG